MTAEEVVYWTGLPWQLGTAAYWEEVAAAAVEPPSYRLGETLEEEVGACILGGWGLPFELASAAFDRLRIDGVFERGYTGGPDDIEALLVPPLSVNGKQRRYRFPRQRARRIFTALQAVGEFKAEPCSDVEFRELLLSVDGIGPKTASWVVRNYRASDQVAIIDVHLARAGIVAGVFNPNWRLPQDYLMFEAAFITWAAQAGVRPRLLDACIWGLLARHTSATTHVLGLSALRPDPVAVWPITADDQSRYFTWGQQQTFQYVCHRGR